VFATLKAKIYAGAAVVFAVMAFWIKYLLAKGRVLEFENDIHKDNEKNREKEKEINEEVAIRHREETNDIEVKTDETKQEINKIESDSLDEPLHPDIIKLLNKNSSKK
jgi:hypothetical protein